MRNKAKKAARLAAEQDQMAAGEGEDDEDPKDAALLEVEASFFAGVKDAMGDDGEED